jgi:hypothetical protein
MHKNASFVRSPSYRLHTCTLFHTHLINFVGHVQYSLHVRPGRWNRHVNLLTYKQKDLKYENSINHSLSWLHKTTSINNTTNYFSPSTTMGTFFGIELEKGACQKISRDKFKQVPCNYITPAKKQPIVSCKCFKGSCPYRINMDYTKSQHWKYDAGYTVGALTSVGKIAPSLADDLLVSFLPFCAEVW